MYILSTLCIYIYSLREQKTHRVRYCVDHSTDSARAHIYVCALFPTPPVHNEKYKVVSFPLWGRPNTIWRPTLPPNECVSQMIVVLLLGLCEYCVCTPLRRRVALALILTPPPPPQAPLYGEYTNCQTPDRRFCAS